MGEEHGSMELVGFRVVIGKLVGLRTSLIPVSGILALAVKIGRICLVATFPYSLTWSFPSHNSLKFSLLKSTGICTTAHVWFTTCYHQFRCVYWIWQVFCSGQKLCHNMKILATFCPLWPKCGLNLVCWNWGPQDFSTLHCVVTRECGATLVANKTGTVFLDAFLFLLWLYLTSQPIVGLKQALWSYLVLHLYVPISIM